MIKNYGADAVRWFILSDSPPEKDIQWSDSGVVSSSKFLQKIWDLSCTIKNRKERKINKKDETDFILTINGFVNKINNSINDFRFNVAIASFYEMHRHFNINLKKDLSNKVLIEGIVKFNQLLIPFTPHLSHECLELFNFNNVTEWPIVEKDVLEEINFAVQVNGKTRDIIKIRKDSVEEMVNKKVLIESKARKYIKDKKIVKTIFVNNKIINYIVSS